MEQITPEFIKEHGLRYVSDSKPGITRKASWKKWVYFDVSWKKITDEAIISRLNKLVLPPAWQSVWISPISNGHLQATWLDSKGRKQYRYHADWTVARNQSKFSRMKEFGRVLTDLRKKIQYDLNDKDLSKTKVVALAVSIMDKTGIRVWNEVYEKLYWSFWLTTLHNKHAKILWDTIQFQFTGKKGVKQKISLKSKKLTRIIQQCIHLPGYDLFEYIDNTWDIKTITSDDINEYIKAHTGDNFSAKDFRTWHGTVYALWIIHSSFDSEEKITLPKIIDQVALELGNTRIVCKKYYIHPIAFSLFEDEEMKKYMIKFCANCKEANVYESLFSKLLAKA